MTPSIVAPSTLLTVRPLTTELEAWDNYVHGAPDGLPLHLSGWRDVMSATYGYNTHYLLAVKNDAIAGVLPLFAVPSRLTGRRLMTPPGGLCADDQETAVSLLRRAQEMAQEMKMERVVIQDSRQAWADGWQIESNHESWLLPLPEAEETLWKALDSNIRRQVRKARKNELRAEVDRSGALLDPFYDMFSRFTHQVGTPVFSKRFLQNIMATFPTDFNIALIWHEDEPVAGYFQLEMNDTMYGMWGAALPESLQLRSAYLALWTIMSDAIKNKFDFLDMGRSPAGSNASKFKGQWGGESSPIYQLTTRENGLQGEPTMTDKVQSDQRFQLFVRLWPKLPLSLSRKLGPSLRRHIPFA